MGIGDERERLQMLLNRVRATLEDAEEMQIRRENMAHWLRKLRDLADDIEDVLDDFEYEDLRCKIAATGITTAAATEGNSSCGGASSGGAGCSSSQLYDAMTGEIADIWRRFDEIAQHWPEALTVPLEVDDEAATRMEPNSEMRETSSFLKDPEVLGRDDLKEEIIEFLVGNTVDRFSVLAIVGIGGVGKTTLAKFVYGDERVGSYFHQKIWVHVSYDFDVIRTTQKIIEHVVSPSLSLQLQEMDNLDVLHVALADALRDKRFLLVLDDMWYEDRIIHNFKSWETLCAPLLHGGMGSKMLVTTRAEQAVGIAQPMKQIDLDGLGFEHSWSLFKKHAFLDRNPAKYPNFEGIGKEIVKKLKGVPLAVITMGSLLCSKSQESQWRSILESELWELEQGEDGIMPALRLSYEHLPPHLKPCFAYVSAFEKGRPFYGLEVVQLWMALGCIQSKGIRTKRMEDVGTVYLNCLLRRSLIQSIDHDTYIIHDLLRDLGRFILNEDRDHPTGSDRSTHEVSAGDEGQHHLPPSEANVRHAAKKGRTCSLSLPNRGIYLIHSCLFMNWANLRFLNLFGARVMELPDSIGELRHLRYLDIRKTLVRLLPESLCGLYMLQTLKLQECDHLDRLPRGMSNLISLRYLDARQELVSGISEIGKLVHLQQLSVFSIPAGGGDGIKLEDLEEMDELRGTLCIQNLQRVASEEEASRADLRKKLHIKKLHLEWVEDWDANERNSELEEAVLDALLPPPHLKELSIKYCDGAKFPSWMDHYDSMSRLESMTLHLCRRWDTLPHLLGQLPSINTLDIACLPGLRELPPLPITITNLRLQVLGLSVVPGLERLSSLQELVLCNIPHLMELPPLPTTLKTLTIVDLPELKALPTYSQEAGNNSIPLLHELGISGCHNLRSLGGVLQPQLPYLAVLSIRECKELVLWPEGEGFPATLLSLREELRIENCPKLMPLPAGSVISPSLKKLRAEGCPSFSDVSLFVQLQNMKCLTSEEGRFSVKQQYPDLKSCSEEALQQMKAVECLMVNHEGVNNQLPSISLHYFTGVTSAPRRLDLVSFQLLGLDITSSRDDDEYDDTCRSVLSMCLSYPHLSSSLRSLSIYNMPYGAFAPPPSVEEEEEEKEDTPSAPNLPLLEELTIFGCGDMRRLPVETLLRRLVKLKCLGIFRCPELTLPSLEEAIQCLPSLQQLYISACPKLQLLPMLSNAPPSQTRVLQHYPSSSSSGTPPASSSSPFSSSPLPLHDLHVDDVGLLANRQFVCDHLASLQNLALCSPFIQSFPVTGEEEWTRSLRRLTLMNCHHLRELPRGLCSLFPCLVSLDIRKCPHLRCIPLGGLPASLKFLDIEGCPGVEVDWPNVAHVRVILTDGKIMQGSYKDYEELIADGTMVRMFP